MIASGRVAYLARRGADFGVRAGAIRIDMRRVRRRKRDIVEKFRTGSQGRLEKTKNLELIFGEASFVAPKTLAIRSPDGSSRTVTADRIFINAGCRPAVPALEGLGGVPFLTSTSIMELGAVPEHLLVLGGGYIGLEFGQLFRRLGSRVTIVQSSGRLLAREDPDIADEVASILEADGVRVFLNAQAAKVKKIGAELKLTVRTGGRSTTLTGSHLLVATGRRPNTDTLNLAAAGIATDPRCFI